MKQIHMCASIFLSVKWNIGRIFKVPFEMRKARSITHSPRYWLITHSASRSVLVIYPFNPSHLQSSAILLHTDAYVNILTDFKELVVASALYLLLGDVSALVGFLDFITFLRYVMVQKSDEVKKKAVPAARPLIVLSYNRLTSSSFPLSTFGFPLYLIEPEPVVLAFNRVSALHLMSPEPPTVAVDLSVVRFWASMSLEPCRLYEAFEASPDSSKSPLPVRAA